MTTKELKSEIQKTLDNLPKNVLENLLAYLKELEDKSKEDIELSQHFSKILKEDKEVLQRLAK